MKREKSPSSEACATDLTVNLGSWAFLSSSVSSMVLNCPTSPALGLGFCLGFLSFFRFAQTEMCRESRRGTAHAAVALEAWAASFCVFFHIPFRSVWRCAIHCLCNRSLLFLSPSLSLGIPWPTLLTSAPKDARGKTLRPRPGSLVLL